MAMAGGAVGPAVRVTYKNVPRPRNERESQALENLLGVPGGTFNWETRSRLSVSYRDESCLDAVRRRVWAEDGATDFTFPFYGPSGTYFLAWVAGRVDGGGAGNAGIVGATSGGRLTAGRSPPSSPSKGSSANSPPQSFPWHVRVWEVPCGQLAEVGRMLEKTQGVCGKFRMVGVSPTEARIECDSREVADRVMDINRRKVRGMRVKTAPTGTWPSFPGSQRPRCSSAGKSSRAGSPVVKLQLKDVATPSAHLARLALASSDLAATETASMACDEVDRLKVEDYETVESVRKDIAVQVSEVLPIVHSGQKCSEDMDMDVDVVAAQARFLTTAFDIKRGVPYTYEMWRLLSEQMETGLGSADLKLSGEERVKLVDSLERVRAALALPPPGPSTPSTSSTTSFRPGTRKQCEGLLSWQWNDPTFENSCSLDAALMGVATAVQEDNKLLKLIPTKSADKDPVKTEYLAAMIQSLSDLVNLSDETCGALRRFLRGEQVGKMNARSRKWTFWPPGSEQELLHKFYGQEQGLKLVLVCGRVPTHRRTLHSVQPTLSANPALTLKQRIEQVFAPRSWEAVCKRSVEPDTDRSIVLEESDPTPGAPKDARRTTWRCNQPLEVEESAWTAGRSPPFVFVDLEQSKCTLEELVKGLPARVVDVNGDSFRLASVSAGNGLGRTGGHFTAVIWDADGNSFYYDGARSLHGPRLFPLLSDHIRGLLPSRATYVSSPLAH